MKALVFAAEHSSVKFEDFTFDVPPSLFLHYKEFEMWVEKLDDEDDKLFSKYMTNYDVHKSQVLHTELVDRGIMDHRSHFNEDFNSDDMTINKENLLNGIYMMFEICIF